MAMGMRMERPHGTGDMPRYERGPGVAKPRKVAIAIPHTNEIPAARPFRTALAKRLIEEGIRVSASEENGMMKRGWEARGKIDADFRKRIEKRLEELAGASGTRMDWRILDWRQKLEVMGEPLRMLETFGGYALSAILSMEDHARRVKLIGECTAAGNDLVVELHAMNPEGRFGAEDVEGGLRGMGGADILFAPDAVGMINSEFLANRNLLADNANIAHAAYGLSGIIGMDIAVLFIEYFQARDRVRQLGGRAAIIEVPSERAGLPAAHPMRVYYQDESRSEFEMAYCACTREPVGFSHADIEAAAWALGAIDKKE